MLAIIGTIPDSGFPLVSGEVRLENNCIHIQGERIDVYRGTPALIAAAIRTAEFLGQHPPLAYLVGDTGLGKGSRMLYEHLSHYLPVSDYKVIAFHYIQPNVNWHNRVLLALEKIAPKPITIADAGFMYAAKMSGQATAYDLFTPDLGELAFLADEEAPHPFYTRGFILHEENRLPDLVSRAYKYENAARYMLIKGVQDYLVSSEGIRLAADSPVEEAMEAIGGTGDTLTGVVATLIHAGIETPEAALIAARTNRLAGYYARPTPATQVMEIIHQIPKALEKIFEKNKRSMDQGHA